MKYIVAQIRTLPLREGGVAAYRFSHDEALESRCSHEIHEDAGHWE